MAFICTPLHSLSRGPAGHFMWDNNNSAVVMHHIQLHFITRVQPFVLGKVLWRKSTYSMNKCHENGSTGLGYTIWADYSCDGLSTAGWEPNNSMFCSVLLHANSKPSWLKEIQIPLRINSVTKKILGAFPGKKQLTGLPAKELCSFASVLFLNKLRHITQPNTVMEVLEILDQRGSDHLQHLKKKWNS